MECKADKPHHIIDCWMFQLMNWTRRMKTVMDHQLCTFCLDALHPTGRCPKGEQESFCSFGCSTRHHSSLCWERQAHARAPLPGKEPTKKKEPMKKIESRSKQDGSPKDRSRARPWKAQVNTAGSHLPVRMLAQSIEVGDRHQCRALWDSGSQATLVTQEFARRANLKPVHTEGLLLMGLGDLASDRADKAYDVPLRTRDGKVVRITAHALESLTAPLQKVDLSSMAESFPEASPEEVLGVSGEVEMLIGLDAAGIFPKKTRCVGRAALWASNFGSRWMLVGSQPAPEDKFCRVLVAQDEETALLKPGLKLRSRATSAVLPKKMTEPCSGSVDHFVPSNFIAAEAMGTEVPRRCPSCRHCKECQFKMDCLSFKENKELEVIMDGLVLDVEAKKWTAAYPFCEKPELLIDNYQQALQITEAAERRLHKQG